MPPTPSDREPTAAPRRKLTTVDGLAQLAFLVHGTLDRRAAEHGLSIIQTRLLGVLRDRTPPMNALAALLELDKSSITGLVDRAERRGLVVRTPSATDGRAVLVSLTDPGRALAADVSARFSADVSAILDGLSPADRGTLSGLVNQVLVAHAAGHGIDLFDTDTDTDNDCGTVTGATGRASPA